MKFGMTSLVLLAAMASAPAYAQNPFMDRAKEAAAALTVEWDPGAGAGTSSAQFRLDGEG